MVRKSGSEYVSEQRAASLNAMYAALETVRSVRSSVERRAAVSSRRLSADQDTATSTVPQPLAIDATVRNDFAARDLIVSLGDYVTGAQRIGWTNGLQALRWRESGGSYGNVPTLWGHTKTVEQVAHGVPDDDGQIKFHFEPGNTAYSGLVSKPGLRAIITYDRAFQYFLRCLFLHRPS